MCGGKNGIDGCHLAVFIVDIASPQPLYGSLPIPPYESGSGVCYASKKLSKMVSNSASYSVYSRYDELP